MGRPLRLFCGLGPCGDAAPKEEEGNWKPMREGTYMVGRNRLPVSIMIMNVVEVRASV